MKRVFLQNNKGFSWLSSEKCFAKGYLFDKTGNYFYGERLLEYFSTVSSFTDFEERIKYANGCFSVVFKKDNDLYVAVDRIRSIPLFYIRFQGNWVVSDNPNYLVEKVNLSEPNSLALIEFLATGYVTGNETLVEELRQVQAGELIHFKQDDLHPQFYHSYQTNDTIDEEYKDMQKAATRVLDTSFERLITSLKGKTAVVPLSGGYDSRLIAAMLKKFDFQDVICFTYGRKDNSEVAVSKEVAEKLGFKWYFVEYNEALINDFLKEEEFKDYYRFASGMVSMFFMQEYFAVKYLKQENLIPENSVFIPGHSGDFLAGSQLNKHSNLNLDEEESSIVSRIYDVKYCYKKPGKKDVDRLHERIHKSLKEKYSGKNAFSYSIHEDWDFKEKLAKFNFNSITTYTFFGYEYRLPFWDLELVDFFKYLPLHVKINKYLYDDILTNIYFEPLDLNFQRELQPTEADLRKLKLKTRIKKHLPEDVKRIFVNSKDPLFYKEITEFFVEDLERKGITAKVYGNSFNSLIIQWYIAQFMEYLKGLKQ
jgi:asparagine synthase (glutamine-hydrolysing)